MITSQKERLYRLIGSKIGYYIKQIKGFKQNEFAKSIDVNPATISNIISGKQQLSIHLLYDIAEELSVEPKELLPSDMELKETITEEKERYSKIIEKSNLPISEQQKILDIINTKNEREDD